MVLQSLHAIFIDSAWKYTLFLAYLEYLLHDIMGELWMALDCDKFSILVHALICTFVRGPYSYNIIWNTFHDISVHLKYAL